MLLRGIYGCYVYAVDDDLRDYLKQCEAYAKSAISKRSDMSDPSVHEGIPVQGLPSSPAAPSPSVDHDPDPDRRFGKTVVRLRKEKGLSQEDLAFRAGIKRSYMGVIERGEKSPSIDTIMKVAKGLGVTISELFADERNI